MTRAEHARQIDIEEAKAESALMLQRALDRANDIRNAERAKVDAIILRDTQMQQGELANKRAKQTAPLHAHDGHIFTLHEWAKHLGVTHACLCSRIRLHGLATAIVMGAKHKPDRPRWAPKHTIDGETRTLSEWAAHLGIRKTALTQRVARGLSLEEAIRCGGPMRAKNVQRQAGRGVVSNFAPLEGTGGGRLLQESTEITFSEKAKSS